MATFYFFRIVILEYLLLLNFFSFSLKMPFFLWLKIHSRLRRIVLCIMKSWMTLVFISISFWHRFPNSNVIPTSESVHGLDNSQNEKVSKQTSPVGFYSCIHWHCCVHCHNTSEYWHSVFLLFSIQKCVIEHISFHNGNLGPFVSF